VRGFFGRAFLGPIVLLSNCVVNFLVIYLYSYDYRGNMAYKSRKFSIVTNTDSEATIICPGKKALFGLHMNVSYRYLNKRRSLFCWLPVTRDIN